jgi:hypothetical protein
MNEEMGGIAPEGSDLRSRYDDIIQAGFTPQASSRRSDDAELDRMQREQRDRRREDMRELQQDRTESTRAVDMNIHVTTDTALVSATATVTEAQGQGTRGHGGSTSTSVSFRH